VIIYFPQATYVYAETHHSPSVHVLYD